MKTFFLSLLILFSFLRTSAEIKLPALVGDNMILQQNTKVKIWGRSEPNTTLKIKTSWSKIKYSCTSDAHGYWEVSIQTPLATQTPQSITLTEKGSVTINNILIGEVWFASGQSNMEMPLNGFWNCPINNGNQLIATASTRPNIRMFTVQRDTARIRQFDCRGEWQISTPKNIQWWSATAYNFAINLNAILNVPIGIINCSWGGTKVEAWMPIEDIKDYSDVHLNEADDPNILDYYRPFLMYYAMMYPCHNYTIKGFIWYQGCSNIGLHSTYADKMAKMVQRLRDEKGQGDLPFYFVELAPYDYDNANGIDGALLREAQYNAQNIIPNSGLICTNDLARPDEIKNIHPAEKSKIGERLAYLALVNDYKIEGICCHSPSFKSIEIKDGKAYISFNNAKDGFFPWSNINGFEIAGDDHKFVCADAELDRYKQKIIVSAPNITDPKAVRYCFKNFQLGNLINPRGLPVFPFRTDNWE